MTSPSPSDILTHHLTAFGNNDLDAILLDYTEESEISTAEGSIKGLDNIRNFFAKLFVDIPTGCEFEMKKLNISGNIAHIIWASKSDAADIPLGSDTFIFADGKIKFHTVALLKKNV